VYLQADKVDVGRGCVGWREVDFQGDNLVAGGTWFSGSIRVGYGSRIGVGCIIDGPLEIGRYCAIGGHVSIGAGAHPMETAALFNARLLFDGRRRALTAAPEPTTLGHDVWIGAGARIRAGVHIGNGAVVGAGAVVTRDVPAFSVVAGAPAKELRRRFDPVVAELVEQLSWWDRSPDELAEYEELLAMDLTQDPHGAAAALRRFIDDRSG
jgi:acetyltransferase-like isoleucine patch superfamily enzyme